MRNLTMLSACLLAACGGAGEEKKAEQAQAATVEAGQWETSFEVTAFRSTDKTTPAVKAAVGDKESGPTCIPAGGEASPPGELFAGPGYKCQTQSSYIRNGRINVSLKCTRAGINGDMMQTVQGSYTGTGFEGTVETLTYLSGPGDFAMTRKITGRKTGATCAAAEEPGLEKSGSRGG
ncbi:MAG TPA: DUF3617 family protein [Allosphingosinicella sp.]